MNIRNFDDKEYEIIYCKVPEKWRAHGLCDNPESKHSTYLQILIDEDLGARRQLNVLIEEVFHAFFFDLPEYKARKFAANLGKVIYNKYLKNKK